MSRVGDDAALTEWHARVGLQCEFRGPLVIGESLEVQVDPKLGALVRLEDGAVQASFHATFQGGEGNTLLSARAALHVEGNAGSSGRGICGTR